MGTGRGPRADGIAMAWQGRSRKSSPGGNRIRAVGARMEAFPAGDSLPAPAFSALHLLRNYNQLFMPPGNSLVQVYHRYPCGASVGDLPPDNFSLPFPPLAATLRPYSHYSLPPGPEIKSGQALLSGGAVCARRRPRGEKKPIPDEQKDDRYYERRKRNNQAAKKSRDARKLREDQIALRATLLEHENAILRAQLLTLREETESLRQVLLTHKKPFLTSSAAAKEETDREKEIESGSDCDRKWEREFELTTARDFRGIVE